MLALEVHLDLHGGPGERIVETLRYVESKAAEAEFPRVDNSRPVLRRGRERHPAVDQATVGGKRLEQDGGLRARQRDAHAGDWLLIAIEHLAGYRCHAFTKNKERVTMRQ